MIISPIIQMLNYIIFFILLPGSLILTIKIINTIVKETYIKKLQKICEPYNFYIHEFNHNYDSNIFYICGMVDKIFKIPNIGAKVISFETDLGDVIRMEMQVEPRPENKSGKQYIYKFYINNINILERHSADK